MTSGSSLHTIDDTSRAAIVLHPLRLEILAQLREPHSASGLARRLGLPRQKLNYHLRQLEHEGLVELDHEQKKGNCTERVMRAVARSFVISPEALGRVAPDPRDIRDKTSSAYVIATAEQTVREVSSMREKAHDAKKRLPTLTLQSEVRFASPADQHAFAQELAETLAGLVEKYHDESADGGRRFRVLANSYPAPKTQHDKEDR